MAEDKKSFILYADIIHTVRKMPKDKQAELFLTILSYVNDENPVVEDLIVSLVWEPIKQQLKRDLKEWEIRRQKRVNAGRQGGLKRSLPIPNEAMLSIAKQSEAIQAVNVSVNGNVNVNDTVNVSESNTHPLKNSNLFRQPNIPEKEDVRRAFLMNGGTEEMATAFFDKNQSTGWFLRGSPITNFLNLIPSFITNWNKNESNGKRNTKTSAEKFAARVEHANRYGEDGSARVND